MSLCQLAGFTLQEADDVRRAMGKKKHDVLQKYKIQFINGLIEKGLTKSYADDLWIKLAGDPDDPDSNGFADYCFNKSHSVAYAVITYLCAYFKSNYAIEFFTALMTIRSQVTQPKDWAQKAPEYVHEAKNMGVSIEPPYIQLSKMGFTIEEDKIYFGLNAITRVGSAACNSIVEAQKAGPFKDIWDFLARIDRRKITTLTFECLVKAGAFDRMGYRRKDLIEKGKDLYAYLNDKAEYEERKIEIEERLKENLEKDNRREELSKQIKDAKELQRKLKRENFSIPESIDRLCTLDKRLRETKKLLADIKQTPEEILTGEDLREYNESIWLRKKPNLKPKQKPILIELTRSRKVDISIAEIMEQAEYIGCYLQQHPAPLIYPEAEPIYSIEEGSTTIITGQVTNSKMIIDKRGNEMAFFDIGDGTGIAQVTVFSRDWAKHKQSERVPIVGDIICIKCRVDSVTDSAIKVIANQIYVYM